MDVIVAIEIGVNAALQCHLGGAHVPRFFCPLSNVLQREQVWRAAQIKRKRTFRETTELALKSAHIGVIDIAVVHPRDNITHRIKAQFVGYAGNRSNLWASGGKQIHDFLFVDAVTKFDTAQNFGNAPSNGVVVFVRNKCWRRVVGAGIPLRGAVPNQNNFRTIVNHVGGSHFLWPHLARIVAA